MPQNIAKSAVERTSKRLLNEVFVSLGKVKRRAVCLRFRLCKGDSPFCMLPTINIYSTAYTEGFDPFIPLADTSGFRRSGHKSVFHPLATYP